MHAVHLKNATSLATYAEVYRSFSFKPGQK
jgi:hypothetical protein